MSRQTGSGILIPRSAATPAATFPATFRPQLTSSNSAGISNIRLMKRTALLLLLLTLRYGAQAAVDFTAAESIREQDGITFPELIFHQDGHKITYEAPRGWSHSGGGSEIRFTPPALSQAQATIEQSPLITSQAFDDATVKLLQQKMIESIPTGSTNVKIVSEEKNPLTPNGYDTYELLVSYENYGHAFT